jgi:hypothetical protein
MGKQEQHRITGIVRNLPASVVEDFSCAELVNMRNKDGVWRPVNVKKTNLKVVPNGIVGSSKLFLHTTGTTQQMIGYKNGVLRYFDYPNGTVANPILTLPEADSGRKVRFNAVGSILVIFVEAGEDGEAPYMKYAVWGGDSSNSYVVLPKLPEISFNCAVRMEEIYESENDTYDSKQNYNPPIPDGYYGTFHIRAAYRTITGDYIFPSRIMYGGLYKRIQQDSNNGSPFDYYNRYFRNRLYFSVGTFDFSSLIPNEWKKIIVGISVFMTEPHSGYRYDNFARYLRNEKTIFYRIYDIDKDLEDVISQERRGDYFAIPLPEKDALTTRETLDIIDSCDYFGYTSYVYNSHLFIGDVVEYLPTPYTLKHLQRYTSNYAFEYFTKVKIKTDFGYVELLSDVSPVSNDFGDGKMCINQFRSLFDYPDERAEEITLYVKNRSDFPVGGCWAYPICKYNLETSKDLNFAFLNNLSYIALNLVLLHNNGASFDRPINFDYKLNGINSTSIGFPLEINLSGLQQEQVVISNEVDLRNRNKIKASSLALPNFYPIKNTYTVGDKPVVGFSANNLSIDASNFGMFPVFVFTEGGIYAMELGMDGEMLIRRIVPMSGDVCISRDSITNIGGATLFASKDGLRILQGQRSEKITTPLEIYEGNPLRDAKLKSEKKILDAIMEKYGLQGYVSSETDFQSFLSGAKCYFYYKENEVVITNEAYPYSYVYSLNTKMYHKVFERYYNVFNDYPNAYGTDAGGYYIYNLGEEVVAPISRRNVLVQTNAFKLTTDGFEMIRRIFTRFGWSTTYDGNKIGIYLFVSNDTRKWAWVDGCEITRDTAPNGAQNFSPLRCPASVKYGILMIAGDMDVARDYLTHISVEYEQRYNNKLR